MLLGRHWAEASNHYYVFTKLIRAMFWVVLHFLMLDIVTRAFSNGLSMEPFFLPSSPNRSLIQFYGKFGWGAIEGFLAGRDMVKFNFPNGRRHELCDPSDSKMFREVLESSNLPVHNTYLCFPKYWPIQSEFPGEQSVAFINSWWHRKLVLLVIWGQVLGDCVRETGGRLSTVS